MSDYRTYLRSGNHWIPDKSLEGLETVKKKFLNIENEMLKNFGKQPCVDL